MNTTNPSFKRFLTTLVLVLIAGAAAITAFVAIVDPYGVYGIVNRPNFNSIKPGLNRYQTEIKQERAIRLQPNLIILGNSRAEIGFDPHAAALEARPGNGYNLAIPGTGVSNSARQFADLVAAGVRPQTVILGIEFVDFLRATSAPPRPAATAAAPAHGTRFWRFDTLFSLASVKDAIGTLRIQHNAEAATIAPDGFNPLNEYRRYVRDDGYFKIFRQRAQESAVSFRSKSTRDLGLEDFTSLHTLLASAADTDAEVKLVIYPYHAQMLAMFEAAGLWPLFEEWKRRLVEEVAALEKTHPGARITLLDFSGFGTYNCEPIPGENEPGGSTNWYWEAGHFKKELGDIVLARVMSPAAGDAAFGIKLDAASEQSNMARIAAERASCAAAQPELFVTAGKLFAKRS